MCSLEHCQREGENRISHLPFLKILWQNLRKECFQLKSKIGGFRTSVKMRPAKLSKTKPPPIIVATKTNVADDAIEVVDDSTAPGSSKEIGNKKRPQKRISNSQQASNRVSGNK